MVEANQQSQQNNPELIKGMRDLSFKNVVQNLQSTKKDWD